MFLIKVSHHVLLDTTATRTTHRTFTVTDAIQAAKRVLDLLLQTVSVALIALTTIRLVLSVLLRTTPQIKHSLKPTHFMDSAISQDGIILLVQQGLLQLFAMVDPFLVEAVLLSGDKPSK
jgi:hypothetical protein